MSAVNVEEKLFQNRYKVDHGRPHIQIKDADVCRNDCDTQACTFVCPAKRPCTQMMGLAKAFYLGEIKKGGNK